MIMITVALLLSLVLCLLLGVPYIDYLRRKMIGQYVLDAAPEAHAKKAGTPTTGGVFIIISIFEKVNSFSQILIYFMYARKFQGKLKNASKRKQFFSKRFGGKA